MRNTKRSAKMTVCHEMFGITTEARPTFHDITGDVKDIVRRARVKNGIACVYSQHTTCSIMIQEESHDALTDGTKFLLQDLLDVFDKIIPRCTKEGQYHHPGPKHLNHAVNNLGEEAVWSLNTDAHLRSCLMGRSETIPIVDGKLELGEFGQIYFIDFDAVRARERIIRVQVIGE